MSKKIINLGDFFEIKLNEMEKVLTKERVDTKYMNTVIDYFKENKIESFKATLVKENGKIEFQQDFFDEEKNPIIINGKLGEIFILHLDAICKKENFKYSNEETNNNQAYMVNGKSFYDGDLLTFPLSSFNDYDKNNFREFNYRIA